MPDISKDTQSLTTFRRRSGDFMKQLRRNKRPVALTVRGIAAQADAEEGVRRGLEDAEKGNVRPAREFFDEFEDQYGIPR